jgi:hypothetical protein
MLGHAFDGFAQGELERCRVELHATQARFLEQAPNT